MSLSVVLDIVLVFYPVLPLILEEYITQFQHIIPFIPFARISVDERKQLRHIDRPAVTKKARG